MSPYLKRFADGGSLLGVLLLVAISLVACDSAGGGPTLMYFRASNCPYCKEMTPLVDEIRDTYSRQLEVVYATIDEPEGKKLAHQHGILGYPTVILLDAEGEEVGVLRGVVPKTAMVKMIDELLQQED